MATYLINGKNTKFILEDKLNLAIETTSYRLLGTLQQLILSEYYTQYEPDIYKRTYQFFESATTKMVAKCFSVIFIDKNSMDYGEYWNGELQLQFSSRGMHGSTEIQTEGRFWEDFINFCDNNTLKILKEELKKQGISIK